MSCDKIIKLSYLSISFYWNILKYITKKKRFYTDLKSEEQQEKLRFLGDCSLDPTLKDRISILTRTFQNKKRMIENDPVLFQDDVFKVEPAVSKLKLILYNV